MGKELLLLDQQDKVNELISGLEGIKEAGFEGAYDDISASVRLIQIKTENLTRENLEKGLFPEFTEKDKKELQELYDRLNKQLGTFERKLDENIGVEQEEQEKYTDIIVSLQKFTAQDSFLLSRTEPAVSFRAALEMAAEPRADITDVELGKVGGAQSSRIPMTIEDENGNKVKGFFTKEEKVDPMGRWNSLVSRMEEKYGPDAAAPLKKLIPAYVDHMEDKDPDLIDNPWEVNAKMALTRLTEKIAKDKPSLAALSTAIRKYVKDADTQKLYKKNPDTKELTARFDAMLAEAAPEAEKLGIFISFANGMDLKEGDNIDQRNSAMSMVADLLGKPNLIAKAQPMTLVNKGTEIKGTFMANAEGVDISNPSDPLPRKRVDLEYTNGFRDLADLQVLDYICGNLDRHIGNLFYKFDENGKFTGIQGIDNDSSFGGEVPRPGEKMNRVPPLENFGYVSKSMYDQVMSLDQDVLRTRLHKFDMDVSEITAACIRLENMKTYFRRHASKNDPSADIQIIDDDKFQEINFYDPDEKGTPFNYLDYMNFYNDYLEKKKYQEPNQPYVRNDDAASAGAVKQKSKEFGLEFDELQKIDAWYIPSSKEFRKLKTALKDLKSFTESVRDKELTQGSYQKMKDLLNVISQQSDLYLKKKNEKMGTSEYAKKRLEFVKKCKAFAAANIKQFEGAVKQSLEQKQKRNDYGGKILDELQKKIDENGMTKELALETIRRTNEVSAYSTRGSKEAVRSMSMLSKAGKYLSDNKIDLIRDAGLTEKDLKAMRQTIAKGQKAQQENKEKVANTSEIKDVQKTLGTGITV